MSEPARIKDTMDLHSDVRFLTQIVNDLDNDVRWYVSDGSEWDETLESDLIALAMIQEARRNLATIEKDLTDVLAKAMPDKCMTVEGAGTFERSKKKDRTAWEKDALLSAVLDSRLFDRFTGALVEETPLDRVLAVYNLPAPRITALRDRNIDADQFCHVETSGWTIRHQS